MQLGNFFHMGVARVADPLYLLYADESRALDGVTAIQMGSASFTDAENPQRVLTSEVTASFFDMLRTPPRIGRAFGQRGARDARQDAEPVVLLLGATTGGVAPAGGALGGDPGGEGASGSGGSGGGRGEAEPFGADPDVGFGRLVDVDGSRTEVVGVMPPGFTFLLTGM